MEMLKWLNAQLLKMDWLSSLVRYALEDLLGVNMRSRMGASLYFMIYDTIKIFILLSVLIFLVS